MMHGMSQLHQIQVRYVATEDRALLRVAARGAGGQIAEYRFWMTRRYATLLLSALSKNVLAKSQTIADIAAENQPAVLAFQHDTALEKSDFKTTYSPSVASTPLGDAPILLARVGITRLEDGNTVLALHPASGQGIEIRLNDTLTHSLIKLVEDAARTGAWKLSQTVPSPVPVVHSNRMN